MPNLIAIQKYFEMSMHLSIYLFMFLLIIGISGSVLTLMVLSHSTGKLPRIGGLSYLKLLNISNCVFLILHWFIITSQIINIYYNLGQSDKYYFKILNLINSSNFSCKILNYLCTVARSFSTYLTLYFTLERGFATYFPLKMMRLRPYFSTIYFAVAVILLCILLVISSPELFTYELVDFHFNNSNKTLVLLCDIKPRNIEHHERFRFFYVIITLVAPFFIIVSVNIAIGFELKKRKNALLNDYMKYKEKSGRRTSSWISRFMNINSKNEMNKSISITEMALSNAPLATISEVNFSGEDSTYVRGTFNFPKGNKPVQKTENSDFLCSINILRRYKLSFSLKRKIKLVFIYKNNELKHEDFLENSKIIVSELTKKDKLIKQIKNKNNNTKLLAIITTIYAMLNLPYFFNIFYIHLYKKKYSKTVDSSMIELFKYRYHIDYVNYKV